MHSRMLLASTSSHHPSTFRNGYRQTVQRKLDFVKYQGLGNDFILIDNRDSLEPKVSPTEAKRLCNRNFGVGGDGVIFVMDGTEDCDYTMRIYNSDGSEPQMCGNGIRCMAHYLAEATKRRSFKVHTLAGAIVPTLEDDGQIVVDMGLPQLVGGRIPTTLPQNFDGTVIQKPLEVDGKTWLVTCVGMGNPHCVTFGEEDEEHLFHLDSTPVEKLGPLFENHAAFPEKANIEFVEVVKSTHLRAKVWERGAGATLACGTGACAILVAACLEGRARPKCFVELPGGKLEIEWKAEDHHVYMKGPAEPVFTGTALV